MKLQTRLYISSAISILMVVALIIVVIDTSSNILEANERRTASQEILLAVSELDILSHEYLLHHEERMRQQWRLRYDSIGPLIGATSDNPEEDKMILSRLSAQAEIINDTFLKVVANYEEKQTLAAEEASQEAIDSNAVLENRLVASLLISSQSMVSDSSALAEKNVAELLAAESRARNLTLFTALALLASSLVTAFTVNRTIAESLRKLTEGTVMLGEGDFSHRIELNGNDEFSELSRAFNHMVGQLKAVTTSKKDLEAEIGERTKAEEALRENRAELQTILDSVPALVFYKDPHNRFIRVNKAFEDAMKLSKGDLEGKSLFDIYPKELADAYWKDDLEVIHSGKAKRGIIEPLETANGTMIVQTDKIPHTDEKNNVTGVIGFAIDITDRKKAEDALAASEIRYRRLFEAAKDGILILDTSSGKVVDVNPFLKTLLGYSREELIGKELWEIGLFKDIAASKEAFIALQTKGYVRYEDLPLETKDGHRIDVEFVSNVYLIGRTRVIQCNIRDISQRKKAEDLARQTVEELRASNEELMRFNKVMVDRELRMSELKNEVNELLRKLGEPEKYTLKAVMEKK